MLKAAPAEDVVFKNTVEALFRRAFGSRLTGRCVERVREAGIDLQRPLEEAYPRETFYRCVRVLGEELYPEMTEDERMVQLGTTFMSGFEQTLIGKALLQTLRFMGARRALNRMAQNFRTSNNYLKVDVQELGPNEMRITLSQTSRASGYFEGVIRQALVLMGTQGVAVRREDDDGSRCTFHVTWVP